MNKIAFYLMEYSIVVVIIAFIFIMNTTSSVNYEANKSYKLLNSVMVFNIRYKSKVIRKNRRNIAFFTRFKVFLNFTLILIHWFL